MTTQYVSQDEANFVCADNKKKVLIFGDEVETGAPAANGLIQAKFRNLDGFIDKKNLMNEPVLEIYVIDVGQGDSIFIVTPERKKILIDGGVNQRAFRFLAWKYRLNEIPGQIDIDYVVLTHADEDHIKGLIPIVGHPKINVHNVIDSGIATYKKGVFQYDIGDLDSSKKYLVTRSKDLESFDMSQFSTDFAAWVKALKADNVNYSAVSSNSSLDVGDSKIKIDVLGPLVDNKQGYRWLGKDSLTINGHSVVLRMQYGNIYALFPGDINNTGSEYLLKDGNIASKLDSHIFKAPHHGSHDFSPEFLRKVRPQISVISSGDERDYGHPRANFIGAVGKCSRGEEPLVFSTEIAATFVETDVPEPKVKDTLLSTSELKTKSGMEKARMLFKKKLNGMINVRTDGKRIFSARRYTGGWEHYNKAPVS